MNGVIVRRIVAEGEAPAGQVKAKATPGGHQVKLLRESNHRQSREG